MIKGFSMNTFVLRMIDDFKKLSQLGFVMNYELSVDLAL